MNEIEATRAAAVVFDNGYDGPAKDQFIRNMIRQVRLNEFNNELLSVPNTTKPNESY